MAVNEIVQEMGSLVAGADLSANQFYFVKLSTAADKTVLLGTSASYAIGVLNNKPTSGAPALVQVMGEAKVILGGTVTRGDNLQVDAAGKAITQTGTNPIIAQALVSGVAGEIHSVLLVGRPASAGVAGSLLTLHVDLASIATGAINQVTPGFAFTVKATTYVPTVVSSTASKAATLTPYIGTGAGSGGANVTGGVLALTTANTNTLATNVAGTAVTATNTGTAVQVLSFVASAVTTFSQGSGDLVVQLG